MLPDDTHLRYVYRAFAGELSEHPWCVSHYQIRQLSRTDIVIDIVKGRRYDAQVVERIITAIHNMIADERVALRVSFAHAIPSERSGKRRNVISMVT